MDRDKALESFSSQDEMVELKLKRENTIVKFDWSVFNAHFSSISGIIWCDVNKFDKLISNYKSVKIKHFCIKQSGYIPVYKLTIIVGFTTTCAISAYHH